MKLSRLAYPRIIQVDENGIVGGGTHLKPEEVNQLVAERGEEVVFFDGRNAFEARIGKFKNSYRANGGHDARLRSRTRER